MCARWGGEEFIVLLPETDLTGARRVADRLRTAFEDYRVQHGNHVLSATISLGVSEFRAAKNLEDCLKKADKNLYAAKAAGRNCVVAG
jgi:diguanylate cyclase (GGDEF)-like protein